MVNDLEAIKKRRRFLRKSETDNLKSIDEALSIPDNHARIQVLKDNIANKWNDLQEVQASMCTVLYSIRRERDEECESQNEYELRVIEYMAKMMKVNMSARKAREVIQLQPRRRYRYAPRKKCSFQKLICQHLMGMFYAGSLIISRLKFQW